MTEQKLNEHRLFVIIVFALGVFLLGLTLGNAIGILLSPNHYDISGAVICLEKWAVCKQLQELQLR